MNFLSIFSGSFSFLRIGVLIPFFLFIQPFSVRCQGINFELVTGTPKSDDAKCVIQTLDSGYVVVGSTSAFGSGLSDIYLTKITKAGNVAWQQAIGTTGVDKGNALIQTSDSGFAIAGYSNGQGSGGYDVYLARTDKNGALLWSNSYGGMDWDFGNSLIETNSGDFVICGNTYSYGKGNGDVYLLKTNSTGILLWDSAYGGSLEDIGNSVDEAADGGYFVTGTTKSFGLGEEDVYLAKSDATGNMKWEKTYGGSREEMGNDGKATSEGGFVVIGATKSYGAGTFFDYWLLKLDASGDTVWSRSQPVAFHRIGRSICQTSDYGYIIGGEGTFSGNYDMYLHKVDVWGFFQYINTFGGPEHEYGVSVKQTYDGGYVLVGTTGSFSTGAPNLYVVKTQTTLNTFTPVVVVVSTEEDKSPDTGLHIYPNPASDHISIDSEQNSEMKISDLMGRIVAIARITKGSNTIDVSRLQEGIYFINIRNSENSFSGKLIVRH